MQKNNKKYLNMLGLSARARKIMYGEDEILYAIKKGKVFLVIVSEDMAEKSKKSIITRLKNAFSQVSNNKLARKVIVIGTKEENSKAIGKENRAVMGITDYNLANGIVKSILEEN